MCFVAPLAFVTSRSYHFLMMVGIVFCDFFFLGSRKWVISIPKPTIRYLPMAVNNDDDDDHLSLSLYHCCIGYIGEFEIVDDHRSNKIVIELNGRLNKCGVISPRFDVEYAEIEKWIVNLLPSRQFGHIILSTTYGIMTHEEARRKKTGGKILGFFY